jgi:RNA polymerase sigma factor (sigma-70 family)
MTDEALMERLLQGDAEALKILHGRYASTIFGLARRSLGPAYADDVVQEVFFALWHRRDLFDPTRGLLRPWLLSIAHTRVLNELRRQRRHPPSPAELAEGPASDPEAAPDQQAWEAHRREAIQTALEALPKTQRQALRLAFFEDLSHRQVAEFLGLPLGTAKTRIRSAIKQLVVRLAPLLSALVLLVALAVWWRERAQLQREERALRLVTASDSQALRLIAAPAAPPSAHATYRRREGVGTAVITLSDGPPLERGLRYRAWARFGESWMSLGTLHPDAQGKALLIAEGPRLTSAPDELQVTVEKGDGPQPTGEVFVSWARGP